MTSETASTRFLLPNLRALDTVNPTLGQRLRWSTRADHLVRRPDGQPCLRVGASQVPIALDEWGVLKPLRGKRAPTAALIYGVGLGELPDAALRLWPRTRITAWDADPALLRLLLCRRDLRDPLSTGRLTLRLGTDLLAEPKPIRLVEHGVLSKLYAVEAAAWRAPKQPTALVCATGLFTHDLTTEFSRRGWTTWRADLVRRDPRELQVALDHLKPQFAAVVNQVVGLPEALRAAGVPLLTWEVDPATDRPPVPDGPVPQHHLFTFRRSQVPTLAPLGHGSVTWLPLAAPPHRTPSPPGPDDSHYAAPVSFVGTSMTERARVYVQRVLSAVQRWLTDAGQDPATAQDRVLQVLDAQRATPHTWCIPDALDQHCPGFRAWLKSTGKRLDAATMLGELPSAERRLKTIAALGRFGVHVWGDPGWRAIAGSGAKVRGFAGHKHALSRIYQRSQINVDIGRLYQQDIVTMRVFDVLACGGFLIADHSTELCDLFEPGVHLETWKTQEELADKVAHYLAHPDQAARIARAGHAHVNAHHRTHHRVSEMLQTAGLPEHAPARTQRPSPE